MDLPICQVLILFMYLYRLADYCYPCQYVVHFTCYAASSCLAAEHPTLPKHLAHRGVRNSATHSQYFNVQLTPLLISSLPTGQAGLRCIQRSKSNLTLVNCDVQTEWCPK